MGSTQQSAFSTQPRTVHPKGRKERKGKQTEFELTTDTSRFKVFVRSMDSTAESAEFESQRSDVCSSCEMTNFLSVLCGEPVLTEC